MLENTRPLLHAYQADEAELIIPARLQDERFDLRSLRALVESVPDSLDFTRQGAVLTFLPAEYADVPWHEEVGRLVQRHFAPQLFELLPEGTWRLNLIYASPEEVAAYYSGDQVVVHSLHDAPAATVSAAQTDRWAWRRTPAAQREHKIVVTAGEAIVARRQDLPGGVAQYVAADNWQALAEQARTAVLAQGGLLHQEGPYRCPPELAALGTWDLPPAPLADAEGDL